MAGYFITSTDTNAGKTTASLCLMKLAKAKGEIVACMKPVSAGCEVTQDGLRNDDALRLINESSVNLPYDLINPYAFKAPIAPHIAAAQTNTPIDVQHIKDCYETIASKADRVIVEGAGGWLVPINDTSTMADMAKMLELPVILVVGLRLGCLNHALLTSASITASGLALAGWIANHIDNDMTQQQDNIIALKKMIPSPLLGCIAYNKCKENLVLELTVDSIF